MTQPDVPFTAQPWPHRLRLGALYAVLILGLPCLLLLAAALLGGRYQQGRGGTVVDVGLLSVLYPAGIALAGGIVGLGAPVVRRRWHAALLGAAAALPAFALIVRTFDPHDPTALRGRVVVTLACALLLGPTVGVLIFQHEQGSGTRRRRADE